MVKATHKAIWALLALILLFFSLCSICGSVAFGAPASAASNVLADLQRDESFNLDDYPENLDDYGLYVIQIAESADGKLFLYVYQPAADIKPLKATKINMALTEEFIDYTGETDKTVAQAKLYNLTLLNRNGVFAKYKVNEFTVSQNVIRYYNISAIYRNFDSDIDTSSEGQDTESVAYSVGKVFTTTTMNGTVIYYQQPTYVVNILNPYVDYITCNTNGIIYNPLNKVSLIYKQSGKTYLDSHYIAFSTDWEIDKLISADVSYSYRPATSYTDKVFGITAAAGLNYGDKNSETVTLTYDEKFEASSSDWSWGGYTYYHYSWDRIASTSDFIDMVAASDALQTDISFAKFESNLLDKEWVLCFAETSRSYIDNKYAFGVYDQQLTNFKKVTDVIILRLEFESGGQTYNLGTVSDGVGTEYPDEFEYHWYDAPVSFFERIGNFFKGVFDGIVSFCKAIFNFFKNFDWWQWLLFIIAIVIIVVLIISIVKFGIVAVAKFIWGLICAPFRGIAALISKRKEAAPAKATSSKSSKPKAPKSKSRTSTRRKTGSKRTAKK